MANKVFADVQMIGDRIQYQYDKNIRIEFDRSYMYFNGSAFPTGIGGYGESLTVTGETGVLTWGCPRARAGTVTLVAGSATVSSSYVAADSVILLTAQELGTVTAPKSLAVTSRVNGTSFTITSEDGSDTSLVGWVIADPIG